MVHQLELARPKSVLQGVLNKLYQCIESLNKHALGIWLSKTIILNHNDFLHRTEIAYHIQLSQSSLTSL